MFVCLTFSLQALGRSSISCIITYCGSNKKFLNWLLILIYAALPELIVANIKSCQCWINFENHVVVMFTGIADDILKPLVLNKFDKKTQRQLAEIWSYGWILHGVIFWRTQLRKHHKVLYNRGNKFLVWATALSS